MAHFAELDSSNKVIRVLVTKNDDPANDEGYSWLVNTLGGRWVKTSYNAKTNGFRKNFAGVGFEYDEGRDAFIAPKPFPSWTLNEETCVWAPPTEAPIKEGFFYTWNEETKSWDEHVVSEAPAAPTNPTA
jgi:hypothetical protein